MRVQIIKEGRLKSKESSLMFFKDHYQELGKVKYIVLYYAEQEWLINPEFYHQYFIVIGEKAQLWMSGLTWGYNGEGPYGLFELMQMIDPSITYEQIVSLQWMAEYPIMFENVEQKLILKPYNESAKSFLSVEKDRLPRQMF